MAFFLSHNQNLFARSWLFIHEKACGKRLAGKVFVETNVEEIASLVARARDGDKDAFNALVRRFQDAAVGYAYALLGDFQLAEDAAQEALLTAWRELPKLRESAAFSGWFRQIVFSQCRRLTRGKALALTSLDEAMDVAARQPDPAAVAEAREMNARVFKAVAALRESEREVIALFYLGGYSLAEISEFLGAPLNTIKSRLHQGRQHLRERMIQMVEENLRAQRPSRNEAFANRVMALLNAAAAGDAGEVGQLLAQSNQSGESGELVNAGGPHPYWGGEPQALHVAAEWGRAEVVALLLQQGAHPNARTAAYDHWSPLHLAIHHDHGPAAHERVIDLLLAHGAEVDIWAAAALGDAARVKKLLDDDARLANARGPNDATPLHFAATVEVARLLVTAGADLQAKDKYGKAPVYTVAGYGNRRGAAARWLCEQMGLTDIFIACAIGETAWVTKLLAEQPALLHAHGETAWKGETPLNVAALHGQAEVVALLLQHGAEANRKASSGCYPLHLAARNAHLDVARMLLYHGAEVNAREDLHQSTPLGWAEFQGQIEMAQFLRLHGGRED